MLYRIVAILLVATVISANFSRLYVYAGFALNKSYIAKELCENRSRPTLNCNGSCYLMKKLKAAGEKEKNQGGKDNFNRLEISFFHQPSTMAFHQPTILDLHNLPGFNYGYHYTGQHIDAIFRPPKSIAQQLI
jgi:hypothetical protein